MTFCIIITHSLWQTHYYFIFFFIYIYTHTHAHTEVLGPSVLGILHTLSRSPTFFYFMLKQPFVMSQNKTFLFFPGFKVLSQNNALNFFHVTILLVLLYYNFIHVGAWRFHFGQNYKLNIYYVISTSTLIKPQHKSGYSSRK